MTASLSRLGGIGRSRSHIITAATATSFIMEESAAPLVISNNKVASSAASITTTTTFSPMKKASSKLKKSLSPIQSNSSCVIPSLSSSFSSSATTNQNETQKQQMLQQQQQQPRGRLPLRTKSFTSSSTAAADRSASLLDHSPILPCRKPDTNAVSSATTSTTTLSPAATSATKTQTILSEYVNASTQQQQQQQQSVSNPASFATARRRAHQGLGGGALTIPNTTSETRSPTPRQRPSVTKTPQNSYHNQQSTWPALTSSPVPQANQRAGSVGCNNVSFNKQQPYHHHQQQQQPSSTIPTSTSNRARTNSSPSVNVRNSTSNTTAAAAVACVSAAASSIAQSLRSRKRATTLSTSSSYDGLTDVEAYTGSTTPVMTNNGGGSDVARRSGEFQRSDSFLYHHHEDSNHHQQYHHHPANKNGIINNSISNNNLNTNSCSTIMMNCAKDCLSSSTQNVNNNNHNSSNINYSRSDSFKLDKPGRGGRSGGGSILPLSNGNFEAFCNTANSHMKRGQFFQALLLLTVTFIVWDSYYKAMTSTEELLMVKHEETMMMLHLKRIEEQSIHLHESITKLAEEGIAVPSAAQEAAVSSPMQKQQLRAFRPVPAPQPPAVDPNLIKVQMNQLHQMEDELDHEVKNLQSKIQIADRANIVHIFGEGPVQVTLDLNFDNTNSNRRNSLDQNKNKKATTDIRNTELSILLWYDTPHAAWRLIDQVRHGYYDGATFSVDQNIALLATPTTEAVASTSSTSTQKLDFIEQGEKKHEAWTVGLTETPLYDDNGIPIDNALTLFINLQDNSKLFVEAVCVGKVIGGFEALQELTRQVRNQVPSTFGESGGTVTIRRATAAHLTHRESASIEE